MGESAFRLRIKPIWLGLKMKLNQFFFLLLIIGFLSIQSSAQSSQQGKELTSDEGDLFIQQMAEALKTRESMQVNFVQERHFSVFLEPLISKGICFFREPDKLRWEIYESYKSILIYNNRSVAKFDFEQGRLRKLKLGSVDIMREILNQIISWMKGDFRNSSQIYEIKIYRNKDYQLRLIPKSKELLKSIKYIELNINAQTKHVTTVLIKETETDFIQIKFSNEKDNLELAEELFDLKNPLIVSGSGGR